MDRDRRGVVLGHSDVKGYGQARRVAGDGDCSVPHVRWEKDQLPLPRLLVMRGSKAQRRDVKLSELDPAAARLGIRNFIGQLDVIGRAYPAGRVNVVDVLGQ